MLDYTVRISGVKDGNHENFFDVSGKFFESFVNSDISNCEIKVVSILIKDRNKFKLNLSFKGEVYNLLCDLCANKIIVPVEHSISILLHETEEEMDNTDEIIYIKPNQHKIDISQLIFIFTKVCLFSMKKSWIWLFWSHFEPFASELFH